MNDSNTSTKVNVRIDIVSDVVCPWCIIGYKRLEQALELLRDNVDATIHWRPFELNPNMPEGGENLRAHLAAKYGTTLENSIKARAMLTQLGQELGFEFNYFDDMRMFNTFKAHQLIHFAGQSNKATAMKLRLFSAFFSEAKVIEDTEVLVAEAVAVGLDESSVRAVLTEQTYAEDVREEQQVWTSKGISSVPAFIFNNKVGLSGAHEVQTFANAIQSAIAQTTNFDG